jgi:hypothetical protein
MKHLLIVLSAVDVGLCYATLCYVSEGKRSFHSPLRWMSYATGVCGVVYFLIAVSP